MVRYPWSTTVKIPSRGISGNNERGVPYWTLLGDSLRSPPPLRRPRVGIGLYRVSRFTGSRKPPVIYPRTLLGDGRAGGRSPPGAPDEDE
jgi:hypothetical protein